MVLSIHGNSQIPILSGFDCLYFTTVILVLIKIQWELEITDIEFIYIFLCRLQVILSSVLSGLDLIEIPFFHQAIDLICSIGSGDLHSRAELGLLDTRTTMVYT